MDRINWCSIPPPCFKVRSCDFGNEVPFDNTDIYRSDVFMKSKAYLMTQSKPNVHSIFSTLDKRIHRSRRRILSTGLSEKKIRRFEPTMSSQVDIYIGNLIKAAKTRTPVDMTLACKHLAIDISSLFGSDPLWNCRSTTKTASSPREWKPACIAQIYIYAISFVEISWRRCFFFCSFFGSRKDTRRHYGA